MDTPTPSLPPNHLGDPAVAAVHRWLEETGYPLEMRVAAALASCGWSVAQSLGYVDLSEGKDREADVLASTERLDDPDGPWRVELVIECKKGTPGKPWVVFAADVQLPDRVAIEAFSRVAGEFEYPSEAVLSMWAGTAVSLFTSGTLGYGVTTAHQSKDADGVNPASSAIRQVLSATAAFDAQPRGRRPKATVRLPMVITSGVLMSCSLRASGSLQVELIETGLVRVFRDGISTLVRVAKFDYLKSALAPAIYRL